MPASRLHPFLRLLFCTIIVAVVFGVVESVGERVLLAFNPTLGLNNPTPIQLVRRLIHDYALLLTAFAYPSALFIIWLFRTRVDRYSWSSLGFNRQRAASNFAFGALTGILTLSVLFALMWLSGAIQFGGLSQDILTRGWPHAIVALCGYAVAFLLVGFMEETAFRGYGLHNGKEWLGWTGAVWLQAIVFALVHMGNTQGSTNPNSFKEALGALPSLALIAVFFALAYRKTGSLWFPIGFHTAWNFFLGCVFSQPVSAIGTFRLFDVQRTGKNFLSGGDFGAEGSFFLIPIIVGMIYLLWRSPDHPQALADFDEPESTIVTTPVSQPAYATAGIPLVNATDEEEPLRKNRYGARFGSAEGFDSGMLRDLKQMQEARDEAERQRVEAERAMRQAEEAREESLRRAQIAAQNSNLEKEAKATASTTDSQSPAVKAEEPAVNAPVVAVTMETTDRVDSISTDTSKETQPTPESVLPVPIAPPPLVAPPTPIVPPITSPITTTPTAPSAPTLQPASTPPAQPQTPAPSSQPSEAPPKKARPRW